MQALDVVRLAALIAAFAASASKLLPATLPFWERIWPPLSRWMPGIILVLGALPAALTGVSSWEQFALAVMGAAAFALPGTHKNLAAPLKGPPVGDERVSLRPPPRSRGYTPDDTYPDEGLDLPVGECRACGGPLLLENRRVADGCPCNAPRGINHGLVAKNTCTCRECDPAQTGGTRIGLTSFVATLCLLLGLVSCASSQPRPCSAEDPTVPAKLAECKLRQATECKDIPAAECPVTTECRSWIRQYCEAAQ
jgi:hypothetical protein